VTAGLTLERPVESAAIGGVEEPAPMRHRGALVRRLVGPVLTAIGIFLVVLVLFLYAFTPLTASRDQHRLLADLTRIPTPPSTFALTKGVVPAEGNPVGVVRIPGIHLSQAFVAGTSAADLQAGPGLMPGTPVPGTAGNSVIAGRRVTYGGPFGSLASLKSGDSIRITDGLGTFLYTVHSVRTVKSGQPDVIGPAPDNRLTLITSDSSFVTTGRLVVVATLRGLPVASPTTPSTVVPTGELGLAGDPGAGGDILLWVDLLLLASVATGFALWRWRRPWPTYLLAAPVLVACGLFAAQAVALSLPATL
jgi:LPXTG-site transpeptidase (sortase) family protein